MLQSPLHKPGHFRFLGNLKRFLVGNPLLEQQMEHEKLPKWKALPVFSSDALSSVAYATEEILLILAGLSTVLAVWSVPIAIVISLLLLIVALSYRQTISLYPNGGGAYQVAKENLGSTSSLVAGGALLLDYILTVAVSISAGIAALSSAFPWIAHHSVFAAHVAILLVTLSNLRGLRESSFIFSIPTYGFILSVVVLLGAGFYQIAMGITPPQIDLFHESYPEVGWFLLLRAFASGCTALTGIEAISNGVPAFRKPSSVNAKKTLTIMILILGVFFLGITALSHMYGVIPREGETVLSQVARLVLGSGPLYYIVQIFTAAILLIAANTAYADFPRLASLMAADRYMPRQLANVGDRLVFSNGILLLGFAAAMLVSIFSAQTHALIPLYSVGVFVSFTISQFGMVEHHRSHREPGWRHGLFINFIGGCATAVVMVVVAVTKFAHGAWMTVLVIPLMVGMFRRIKRHYIRVAKQLALPDRLRLNDAPVSSIAVIPISGLHAGVMNALQYARGISRDVRVVMVDINPIATKNLTEAWGKIDNKDETQHLVVLPSPYRSVIQPLVQYLSEVEQQNPNAVMTVVVPEFVTRHWWGNFLHNQTALFLKTRLRFIPNRVVVSINYHLNE